MSTDKDFADQLFSMPEATLAKRGWKLSAEELAFLLTAHIRGEREKRIVALADDKASAWRG
jgi:hypothetical protein